MIITFWISLFIIFYTYLGYGILLFLLVKLKRKHNLQNVNSLLHTENLPLCTLVIAAYNEEYIIREKIKNTLSLSYPPGKLKILFVTDGSSDNTPKIIAEYPQIILMHEDARRGKVAAINRALTAINTEIIIFTDANTLLNTEALTQIAKHYTDTNIGAVAGEKRIQVTESADAGAAGEGFYWKYESQLKKWDSELYSVVGAAGELFSIRTRLYENVSEDIILDDFIISMKIAQKGYRIIYEPNAYAIENASANVSEELKRKVRIAAGGIQSIIRMHSLLNLFKYGTLSFQYISHRVLRWTITPFLLILNFILNLLIVLESSSSNIYSFMLIAQIVFYVMSLFGLIFEKRSIRVKVFFIPYYFCVMNYAILAGIWQYSQKRQSSIWVKAVRRA